MEEKTVCIPSKFTYICKQIQILQLSALFYVFVIVELLK
jgi:hypothetical protein